VAHPLVQSMPQVPVDKAHHFVAHWHVPAELWSIPFVLGHILLGAHHICLFHALVRKVCTFTVLCPLHMVTFDERSDYVGLNPHRIKFKF
jgi:hypothetical protein